MIGQSLRWRLILTSGFAIALAMAVAGLGLVYLFDRHIQRVAVADLEARALTLTSMVEPAQNGRPGFRNTSNDPSYEQPFSGQYWQVQLGDDVRRSRSLWDFRLPHSGAQIGDSAQVGASAQIGASPPGGERAQIAAGGRAVYHAPGPLGERLMVLEQVLDVPSQAGNVRLTIWVASDGKVLASARAGFLADLWPSLSLLGAVLLAASWFQTAFGLRPLRHIRARVAALRSGQSLRMGQDLMEEVRPLATEIDLLLDARAAEIARARHRAGDLAHGLKTPLQALLGDARRLKDRGETAIAGSIEAIVASMHRLVDHELARARLQAGTSNATAEPSQIIAAVFKVLKRTPRGECIAFQSLVPAGHLIKIDPVDLMEALGALLENATEYAQAAVTVSLKHQAGRVVLVIADDGAGVALHELHRITDRGVRLDEVAPGQGIGLALVADIAHAAGGALSLRNISEGFEAVLDLPAAE